MQWKTKWNVLFSCGCQIPSSYSLSVMFSSTAINLSMCEAEPFCEFVCNLIVWTNKTKLIFFYAGVFPCAWCSNQRSGHNQVWWHFHCHIQFWSHIQPLWKCHQQDDETMCIFDPPMLQPCILHPHYLKEFKIICFTPWNNFQFHNQTLIRSRMKIF